MVSLGAESKARTVARGMTRLGSMGRYGKIICLKVPSKKGKRRPIENSGREFIPE